MGYNLSRGIRMQLERSVGAREHDLPCGRGEVALPGWKEDNMIWCVGTPRGLVDPSKCGSSCSKYLPADQLPIIMEDGTVRFSNTT